MLRRQATRRAGGRRCVAEGCARSVRPGRVLCPAHARGAYGRELEAAIGRLARQVEQAFTAAPAPGVAATAGPDRRDEVGEAFERRVARGEYGELFDGRLREVMAQAAAERGIAEEIGALRVVLARLMTDPGIDPLHLAHGVARVAGTTVRAMRVQREIEAGAQGQFQQDFAELADALLTVRQQRYQEQERERRQLADEAADEELIHGESRAARFRMDEG